MPVAIKMFTALSKRYVSPPRPRNLDTSPLYHEKQPLYHPDTYFSPHIPTFPTLFTEISCRMTPYSALCRQIARYKVFMAPFRRVKSLQRFYPLCPIVISLPFVYIMPALLFFKRHGIITAAFQEERPVPLIFAG